MNTRFKKRHNARTVRIRTQWAKVNDPEYQNIEQDFEGLTVDMLFKPNPNSRTGHYCATNPNPTPNPEPNFPDFDEDELAYLLSLTKEEEIFA